MSTRMTCLACKTMCNVDDLRGNAIRCSECDGLLSAVADEPAIADSALEEHEVFDDPKRQPAPARAGTRRRGLFAVLLIAGTSLVTLGAVIYLLVFVLDYVGQFAEQPDENGVVVVKDAPPPKLKMPALPPPPPKDAKPGPIEQKPAPAKN